jgi:hypothetical protein
MSGIVLQKVAVEVAAAKVRETLGLLGKVVQSVVRSGPIKDAPALISNVLMYESNLGKKPSKPELTVRDGALPGTVQLIALAVASAASYAWEYSLDQETWTVGAQTAQARSTIAGLRPGQLYSFRVRALKREGLMTEPASIVRLIVR